MKLHVYETGKTIKARQRPIVAITSNNEQDVSLFEKLAFMQRRKGQ